MTYGNLIFDVHIYGYRSGESDVVNISQTVSNESHE